jgi:adenylylsulfate kinase
MSAATTAGFVIWFTGLPASGKTTMARQVQLLLAKRHIPAVLLDSDDLRPVLTPKASYTKEERDWFYSVIAHLAALISKSGVNVLIAATANLRRYRDQARQQITRFAEIYVHCSLEICRSRDPKGIYALADQGKAQNVPGIGTEYEMPLNPEAFIDTSRLDPIQAARSILTHLEKTGFFTLNGNEMNGSAN